MLVNGAASVLLIGTFPGKHRLQSRDMEHCGQVDQLRRSDKEPMIVRGEVAAGSARFTASCAIRVLFQLRIEPLVEFGYFRKDSAVSFGCSHHRVFFRILSTSWQL